MKPKWDEIFTALEKWRANLCADEGEPSVSTVAQTYRQDPWAVLVSTIISLRTKDEVTIISSKRLLDTAGSPAELLKKNEKTI